MRMSREIKFRAWDKKRKRYAKVIQTTNQGWKGYRDKTYITNGIMCFSKWVLSRFIIEQYTGLKDKNDKEIYEGDIVKFADLELAMKPAGVVCFSDGKFFVKDWEFDDGSYHIVDFYDYNIPYRDFEVIGNIHENPELLEVNNGQ